MIFFFLALIHKHWDDLKKGIFTNRNYGSYNSTVQTDSEIVSQSAASRVLRVWLDHRPPFELQTDLKADLAVSFEDVNVLQSLRLNCAAYQQHVLWISHFGTKFKIAGISGSCIIPVHIKAPI